MVIKTLFIFDSKLEIPEHVDPPFRNMLTHHSGDVDPPFFSGGKIALFIK